MTTTTKEQKWTRAAFDLGIPPADIQACEGFIYNGLGLHERRAGQWTLTHLNSGHAALYIGDEDDLVNAVDAFDIAADAAEAVDWTFKGLAGWKEQIDFVEKLRAVEAKHYGILRMVAGSNGNRSDTVAEQISALRAAGAGR